MMMHGFAYANAGSVAEAVAALDARTRPLAGGTDLLALMKDGLAEPERIVNLKTVPGLAEVTTDRDGLHIGALTKLADLISHPALRARADSAALTEALEQTATPQLRHMATIGGNLLQQPRCWYFRNPHVPCWRKGGQRCYAVRGENKYHTIVGRSPCYAPHPSDPAVALVALDASLVIVGPEARRIVPLHEFYVLPRRDYQTAEGYHPVTTLAADEIVVAITIPQASEGTRSAYVKISERGAWDFAMVSAAVRVTIQGDTVRFVRAVLGGVAVIPWRAAETEAILTGRSMSEEAILEAAEASIEGAHPLEHNTYKVPLTVNAAAQALRSLA